MSKGKNTKQTREDKKVKYTWKVEDVRVIRRPPKPDA